MVRSFEIIRVINNNVLMVCDLKNNKEYIIMAKGLGYHQKKQTQIDLDLTTLNKVYSIDNPSLKATYLDMLHTMNGDVVDIVTDIIHQAEQKLGTFSDRSFIIIADHLSFAIDKVAQGMTIENPFIDQIRYLYRDEFTVAKMARKKIIQRLALDVGQSEVGFIALHLNAAKEHRAVTQPLRQMRLINELFQLLCNELNDDLSLYPLLHQHLLYHLRFFLDYYENMPNDKHPHRLFPHVKNECFTAYKLALKLMTYLNQTGYYHLQEHDLLYLILHLDYILSHLP